MGFRLVVLLGNYVAGKLLYNSRFEMILLLRMEILSWNRRRLPIQMPGITLYLRMSAIAIFVISIVVSLWGYSKKTLDIWTLNTYQEG